MTDAVTTYARMVNAARLQLEAAGNPAYGVLLSVDDGYELEPLVYAALRHAMDHAGRVTRMLEPGQQLFIISRARDGDRIAFTIMDSRTRKLHQQFEVVEKSLSEEDTLM